MAKKNITKEKIIQAFLACSFDKSAGLTSLADICEILQIKKASLYNYFDGKEAMYSATVDYCKWELVRVDIISQKSLDSIATTKTSIQTFFKRMITNFFDVFESDPLFQIYVFIHSEQYFNKNVLELVKLENFRICDLIKKAIQNFSESNKTKSLTEKEAREISQGIANIIIQQRDFYIANRKETMRQNPDCSAGSLFALPTDDNAISTCVRMVEQYLKYFA
jgi:AcrR family transcriptional regulator